MALANNTNPIVNLIHTIDKIIVVDSTGDYNAVTNPTGWGSPNELRSALTDITATVTYPDATTAALTLTSTDFDNDSIRAYNATTLAKQDGVYTIETILTAGGASETVSYKSLRTNTVKCQLAALALGNTDTNDFAEATAIYERMIVAFDCGEYVLVEELLTELEAFFDDCGYSKIKCGCGC